MYEAWESSHDSFVPQPIQDPLFLKAPASRHHQHVNIARRGHIRMLYLSHTHLSWHRSPWPFEYRYFRSSPCLTSFGLSYSFQSQWGPVVLPKSSCIPVTPRVVPMPQKKGMMVRPDLQQVFPPLPPKGLIVLPGTYLLPKGLLGESLTIIKWTCFLLPSPQSI